MCLLDDSISDHPSWHIQGRAYVLSWDLLEYIDQSEWVSQHIVGNEDLVTGSWMLRCNESRANWIHTYMFGSYRHLPEGGDKHTYLLHNAKETWEWNDAMAQRGFSKNEAFMKWYDTVRVKIKSYG